MRVCLLYYFFYLYDTVGKSGATTLSIIDYLQIERF